MDSKALADVPCTWKPKENYGKKLKKFKKIIEDKYNIKLDGFWDLHQWSLDHLPEFWVEMWDFSGIIYSKKFDKVCILFALVCSLRS
ncbi:acetoacetyl-CoA synthetase [Trichonephila clavipes]|nr:acetoacetyl-CoA synthetase [Trichonephila clavipes]